MTSRYGISAPVRNVDSLQRVSSQLKEAIEAVLGYRGNLYAGSEFSDFENVLEYLDQVETRLTNLELLTSFLLDGTYAYGFTDNTPLLWAPGVITPTLATRVPIDIVPQLSNVEHLDEFGFVPIYEADYKINISIRFEPDQNNRIWTAAIFKNNVQQGSGLVFNSRDLPVLSETAVFGVHLLPGETIDIRLWPADVSSSGDILNFDYDLEGRGTVSNSVLRNA